MSDHAPEWSACQVAAERALQTPHAVSPMLHGQRRLLVRYQPAFSDWETWEIVEIRQGLLVRRMHWARIADGQRLAFDPMAGLRRGFSSHPTLSTADASVPIEAFEAHLKTTFSLPVLPLEPYIALDRDVFIVEIFQGPTSLRLEWRADGPSQWEPVRLWVRSVVQFLEDLLPSSSAEHRGSWLDAPP